MGELLQRKRNEREPKRLGTGGGAGASSKISVQKLADGALVRLRQNEGPVLSVSEAPLDYIFMRPPLGILTVIVAPAICGVSTGRPLGGQRRTIGRDHGIGRDFGQVSTKPR